jgi:tRNA pseudouridine55 synthase
VKVSEEEVDQAARRFVGKFEQMPPPYSAKKVAGVPAYKLARKGQAPELKPVAVEVKRFAVEEFSGDLVRFTAQVSAGTYMRTLAHEMGQTLGCGAHLSSLRRIAAGQFDIGSAVKVSDLDGMRAELIDIQRPITDIMSTTTEKPVFLHPRELLPQFPAISANDEMLQRIGHGMALNLPDYSASQYVKVFRGQADLVAVCARVAGTLFHPKVVLMPSPAAVKV